jgi:hypothetical protein
MRPLDINVQQNDKVEAQNKFQNSLIFAVTFFEFYSVQYNVNYHDIFYSYYK